MSPEERCLAQVTQLLDAAGVPYMIAGSLASSHHGRPRSTDDADIVIEPTPETLGRFVVALERWAAELGVLGLWQRSRAR